MMPDCPVRVAGPSAGIVDVWVIDPAAPDLPVGRLVASLDREERQHAERLRVGGSEWATAHGAMRTILAGYLDAPAATLQFEKTATGKPRLAGVSGLEFSFAHTTGLALLAVASDRELGVDVERENDRTDIDEVAREFLPAIDALELERTPSQHRRSAFFAAWARHEARLKLCGQGLGSRLEEEVSESRVRNTARALMTLPGFAAAVAAEGGNWTVKMRRFDPPAA